MEMTETDEDIFALISGKLINFYLFLVNRSMEVCVVHAAKPINHKLTCGFYHQNPVNFLCIFRTMNPSAVLSRTANTDSL